MIVIAVLSLCAQYLAPYLVWRSRWNIPTHLAAGFCVTAYIIPGFVTDVWDSYSDDTIAIFTGINALGAMMVCVGIIIPAGFERYSIINPFSRYIGADGNQTILSTRLLILTGICLVGIYVSYIIMGFAPLLTSDPLSARQFRGIYRDPYYRVAYLYRFSFSVLSQTMGLLLILAWFKRSRFLVILAFLSILALILSLSRGPMAAGVLMFLGILAATQRAGMKWYLPLVILVFPLGSVLFFVLGQLTGTNIMGDSTTLAENIAGGAPDIRDQINWLQEFLTGSFFSYGRTIYGGLIPGNYPWNPGVWTVTFSDVGADVSDLATGGLRLTTAEWGYANFGWAGVVLIPFISGLFNGLILLRLRKAEQVLDTVQMTTALLLYNTAGMQIVNFFFLSIHNIPSIVAAIYLWLAYSKSESSRQAVLTR